MPTFKGDFRTQLQGVDKFFDFAHRREYDAAEKQRAAQQLRMAKRFARRIKEFKHDRPNPVQEVRPAHVG